MKLAVGKIYFFFLKVAAESLTEVDKRVVAFSVLQLPTEVLQPSTLL
jgi:hypothetical protein